MMAALWEISGGGKLAAAVLMGFVLGFTLVKSGLSDPKKLRGLFLLRENGTWSALFLATGLAALLTHYLRTRGIMPAIAGGSFFALLLGGGVCALGCVTAGATSLTALAQLASGRIKALWIFAGGAAAVWGMTFIWEPLQETISRFGVRMKMPRLPREFWCWENPLVWVAGISFFAFAAATLIGWMHGKKD